MVEWSSLEVVRVACQQWWLDVIGVGCESWPSKCSLKLVSQTRSRVHFSTHLISSPHLNISLDFPLSHYLISHPRRLLPILNFPPLRTFQRFTWATRFFPFPKEEAPTVVSEFTLHFLKIAKNEEEMEKNTNGGMKK